MTALALAVFGTGAILASTAIGIAVGTLLRRAGELELAPYQIHQLDPAGCEPSMEHADA